MISFRDRLFCFAYALAMGISAWAWFSLTDEMQRAPKVPNAVTQQVVPFTNHGIIYYVTPVQKLCLYAFFPVIVLLMISAAYIFFGNEQLREPSK